MSYLPDFQAMSESVQGVRFVGVITSCVGETFNIEGMPARDDFFVVVGPEGNGILERIARRGSKIRIETWRFLSLDGSPDLIVQAECEMHRRAVPGRTDRFSTRAEQQRRAAYARAHDRLEVRSTHIDRCEQFGLTRQYVQGMLGIIPMRGRAPGAEVVPLGS